MISYFHNFLLALKPLLTGIQNWQNILNHQFPLPQDLLIEVAFFAKVAFCFFIILTLQLESCPVSQMRRQIIKLSGSIMVHWKVISVRESVLWNFHMTDLLFMTEMSYATSYRVILRPFSLDTSFSVSFIFHRNYFVFMCT